MATNMIEFAAVIDELHGSCVGEEFSPKCSYRDDTDSLFVFLHDELSYQRRVNRVLTVYIGDETREVVGVEVKGYRRIIDNMMKSGMGGVVHDHASLGFVLGIAINQTESETDFPNLSKYVNVNVPEGTGTECEFA